MAVTFVTWLWGNKYDSTYVDKLCAGVRRNFHNSFRFVVFSDRNLNLSDDSINVRNIEDSELIGKGCLCRLRQFDPEWQSKHGFRDTIIGLDLDTIITAPIDSLFDRTESFMILQGVNAVNPNPFNCSVTMLRAGHHAEVWRDFSPFTLAQAPIHEFADDQGWIWYKLPQASGWKAGKSSGIYGFQKPGWPPGTVELPDDAKIVAFIGSKKPARYRELPWMKKHWVVA